MKAIVVRRLSHTADLAEKCSQPEHSTKGSQTHRLMKSAEILEVTQP